MDRSRRRSTAVFLLTHGERTVLSCLRLFVIVLCLALSLLVVYAVSRSLPVPIEEGCLALYHPNTFRPEDFNITNATIKQYCDKYPLYALLMRHRPILAFDSYEQYFPIPALTFVALSGLHSEGNETNILYPPGSVSADLLLQLPKARVLRKLPVGNRTYWKTVKYFLDPTQEAIDYNNFDKRLAAERGIFKPLVDTPVFGDARYIDPVAMRKKNKTDHSDHPVSLLDTFTSPSSFPSVLNPLLLNLGKDSCQADAELQARQRRNATRPYYELRYVFLYSYNAPVKLLGFIPIGEHTGDIEHITVHVDAETLQVTEVHFAAHSMGQGQWVPASRVELVGPNRTHPVVNTARGTHASYPTCGAILRRGCCFLPYDNADSQGLVWLPESIWPVMNDTAFWPINERNLFGRFDGYWGRIRAARGQEWWWNEWDDRADKVTQHDPEDCGQDCW